MSYVVLDLEFNNMRDMTSFVGAENNSSINVNEQCPNEIIEIGAVKLDRFLKVIDKFKVYIKPTVYSVLNPRIKEITGITEEHLENGETFNAAIDKLGAFVGEDSIICSWAKDDISELIINSNYHKYTSLEWIKEYLDIQEYCTKVLAEKKSLSLKNALDKLKIKVDEKKLHDALNDSVYTAEVFKRVFNARVIKNYIVKDIVNMPSIVIRDFSNFSIDKSRVELQCPKCKDEVELEMPLKLFNWKFWGLGYCTNCKSKLLQEIIVRETIKGDKVYSNTSKVLDDVEYEDYFYKYKHTV